MRNYLPGFETGKCETAPGVYIAYERAGNGPPLLLLHGYPQHRVMWRHIAPTLAKTYTVIVADLRGYGDSSTPLDDADHHMYGKRAMAADMFVLMRALGFKQFAVAGHDRGARVTHRLLRDFPDAVSRAALLDIIPTTHFWETLTPEVANGYFHWMFLAQAAPLPETLIGANLGYWIEKRVLRWAGAAFIFEPEVVRAYIDAFTPDVLAASCADYRAGASTDIADDNADFATTKLRVPTLILWGEKGIVGRCYDVLDVWRKWSTDPALISGQALPCGHFLPEEQPLATLAALQEFFAQK